MPAKSIDLANRVLDGIYGGPQLDLPATIQFRLYTTAPTPGAPATEVDTADWTNYAPVDVTNNSTNFPAASGGMKSNGTEISFGVPVIVNPVTVVAFATFDEDTDEYLHFKVFDDAVPILDGVLVRFAPYALTLVEE